MAERLRSVSAIADIPAAIWDALANPPGAAFNPFVSHAFLNSSGSLRFASVARPAGSLFISCWKKTATSAGLVPCYLKSHSMGEYVFDHGFADAFHRAGGNYYPKLQVAVPFTPVPGPRFLAPTAAGKANSRAGTQGAGATSWAHPPYTSHSCRKRNGGALPQLGFLQRQDIQFHWHNQGYSNFQDFLATLSSSKRKNIRKGEAGRREQRHHL